MLELTATTEEGARLIRLAETLAEDLAARAPEHDRAGTFPHDSIHALKRAGFFKARRWRAAEGRRAKAFAASLHAIARDGVSEPGQDLTRPRTTATRTKTGWRIDGHKIFCTGSPAATILRTAVAFTDDDGTERYAFVGISTDAPGVEIHGDWDALGMRASGSHSVSFNGVEVPDGSLRGGFTAGDATSYMERSLTAGLFHAAASLGIAEEAAATAAVAVAKRAQPDARARMLVAENAIELRAARATLSRAAMLVDSELADVVSLFAQTQAAKAFVSDASARIVDRALAASGGAGSLNGHPLARAYRDVRAGSFMHPLGANRAYEFLGDVALGRDAVLH